MLKVDHKRWTDLTETDHHDLNQEELKQLVNELKDAVGEVLKEYETQWNYCTNLENENRLLKASISKETEWWKKYHANIAEHLQTIKDAFPGKVNENGVFAEYHDIAHWMSDLQVVITDILEASIEYTGERTQ